MDSVPLAVSTIKTRVGVLYGSTAAWFGASLTWMDPAFFFQAEDGIRDELVTGVQTCALPIFRHHLLPQCGREQQHIVGLSPSDQGGADRSEERRVGKECRPRWPSYD